MYVCMYVCMYVVNNWQRTANKNAAVYVGSYRTSNHPKIKIKNKELISNADTT